MFMFAVVEIGGRQYKVSAKDQIQVEKLDAEPGKTLTFDKVILIAEENGDKTQIGTPYLKSIKVEAKVVEHFKGEKIRVFKFRPKKRYQVTQGHRQNYTLLEIESIVA
jgi:large subunit ribosomal protein L21